MLNHLYANKDLFSFAPNAYNNPGMVCLFTLSNHHPISTRIRLAAPPLASRVGPKKFILNTHLLKDVYVLSTINIIRLINKNNKDLMSQIDRWNLNINSWHKLLQTIGQKRAKDYRFEESILSNNLSQVEHEI